MAEHTNGKLQLKTRGSALVISTVKPQADRLHIQLDTRDDPSGFAVCEANARRLVACWNYCDAIVRGGLSTEDMEAFVRNHAPDHPRWGEKEVSDG